MNDTIKVNGKTIPWLVVTEGFKIPSFNYEIERDEVPGRPGAVFKKRNLKEYSFELPLIVRNDYLSYGGLKTHDDIMEEMTKFLNYKEPVKLQFDSQDWYWNAYFEGPIEINKTFYSFIEVSINVVLLDPYKYRDVVNENTAISDQVSIVNSGTANTPVVVEATALKNSTYYMVTKNDEDYFMVGDDTLTKEVKDYTPTLFNHEMQNFTGWTKQSTGIINDTFTGGANGGAMKLGAYKDSFLLDESSVGNENDWNGSEYKHSFGRTAQDFSAMVKIQVKQSKKGAARATEYIFDSDNRLLASIGYADNSQTQNAGHIIICLYDQQGVQRKIYDYRNATWYDKWNDIVIYMQLRRVGETFYIKTWKYKQVYYPKRIVPIDVNEKQYVDRGKFYQRPVSAMSVYNAKHKNSNYMPIYIMGTYNYEILPRPVNARDMFIKKGDKLTIDMQNYSVMINEEPVLDRKTFGSDFFNVEEGYSELIIYPENVFDTHVYYQDRYL